MNEIIKMNDLTKIYSQGKLEVVGLDSVNLTVRLGEFVSIMGASGSGKSTMMNILGCLDKATSGSYLLEGEDVSKIKDADLSDIRNKKIGFVFQSFNLLPRLNAYENVELPMLYAGVGMAQRKKTAMEALERVGLEDRIKHKPSELSGGQKQRVAIARSLVNSPTMILADEPTGNLDSKSGEEIMGLFKMLNNDGVTVVLVTHEQSIADQTKRIVLFKDGRIISDTPLKEESA